jgi:RNA polymerase sigma-70 factor (ECF subfamily)
MSHTGPPDRLLHGLRTGDAETAAFVHAHFVGRLVGLARTALSKATRVKVDEDDVAQSVFRTFFRRAAEGQFEVDDSDELWRILAKITVRKCRRQNRHFAASKRNASREKSLERGGAGDWVGLDPADLRAPSPAEAAALLALVKQLLAGLDNRERLVCELRLQGYRPPEIAARALCSEATVYRKLDRIKAHVRQLCPGED